MAPRFPPSIVQFTSGGREQAVEIGDSLRSTIESNGFQINGAKVRLQPRSRRQEVTGLTTNKRPNIQRTYVRQVRAMLHAWEKHGLDNATEKMTERYYKKHRAPNREKPSFARVVRGKIEFIGAVRGKDDAVYLKHLTRFKSLQCGYPLAVPSELLWNGLVREVALSDLLTLYRAHVFHLEILKGNGDCGGATGFLFREDCFVTCAHVMSGRVSVLLGEGQRQDAAAVRLHRARDGGVDLATFTVNRPDLLPKPRIPIRRELPRIGEHVTAIAFPTVPLRRPTLGIYSGEVEAIPLNYNSTADFIQVSIETSGGMSGAPLIDAWGNVVGVIAERTHEETDDRVPARSFRHAVPIRHVFDIDDGA
jgi:hypothetical protein